MTETATPPIPRLGEPPAGHPGQPPRWADTRKQGFGCARGRDSHVWFTLAGGVVTEAYFPTIDAPRLRSLELLVADGRSFTHAEGRDLGCRVTVPEPGVPAFQVEGQDPAGRYRLHKRVIADPRAEALLVEVRYEVLAEAAERFGLYVHLEPFLEGRTAYARVERHGDRTVLVAAAEGMAIALACSRPLGRASVGYAGRSDGRTELEAHHELAWAYEEAPAGFVGLTARIDPGAEPFTLAVGFGANAPAAVDAAMVAAAGSFDEAWAGYTRGWQDYLATLHLERLAQHTHDHARLLRTSAMVLAACEDKHHPGAAIAAPSAPTAGRPGGQVVRPRDLYHLATARLALGDDAGAARALAFLASHQRPDGAWANELDLEGRARSAAAPSQVAYPILLAWRLREVVDPRVSGAWAMARAAALYLARHRPVDPAGGRWQSHGVGSLASEVAALAAAAELAELAAEPQLAGYFGELARQWEASLEEVAFGPCKRCEGPHAGHYRHVIAPPRQAACEGTFCDVDASFLDLVRFGVRPAADPRLASSLAAMDAHLRVVAPHAPAWRRYHGDVHGEEASGRAWPLLTGERGHHELALGHPGEAAHLLHALERLANAGGLLPEQVWDEAEGAGLGRGTGSATPHAWAHAEYAKLARSVADGRVFDRVTATERVLAGGDAPGARWCFHAPRRRLAPGTRLSIEVFAPAELRWSWDGWRTWGHAPLARVAPGVWAWRSPGPLEPGSRLEFTFYWPEAGRWEGRNFRIDVPRS